MLPPWIDAPVLLEESKCTVVREGVQCVCMATGNPEPTIEFYLPDQNITINETDGRYNFYTHTDGHTSTGMIKLREKGERVNNGGPAVNVHCSIHNMYGRESVLLELQQESEYALTIHQTWFMLLLILIILTNPIKKTHQNQQQINPTKKAKYSLFLSAIHLHWCKKNYLFKTHKCATLGDMFFNENECEQCSLLSFPHTEHHKYQQVKDVWIHSKK